MSIILLSALLALASAEYGYIWQITDTHILPKYTDVCEQAQSGENKFGSYYCDSPVHNIDVAFQQPLNFERTEGRAPDVILWTGDHTSGADTDVSEEATIRIIKNVTEQLRVLKKALPDTKIFPVLGNHDSYPCFQFEPQGPFFVYDTVAEEWADFLSPESIATVKKAMYYTEPLMDGLRLVVTNNMLYYRLNKLVNDTMEDPGDQFAWLKSVLNQARLDGERVLLVSHIPPGRQPLYQVMNNEFYPTLHDRLITLLSDYHDIIVAGIYGHDHHSAFRLMYGVKDGVHDMSKGTVHFTGTSVCPNTAVNPGVTLYKFDKAAPFTFIDRTVYYADLTKVNSQPEITFDDKISYSDFGLTDLTLESMAALVDKMEADDAFFNEFRDWMHQNTVTDFYTACDARCKEIALCRLRKVLFSQTEDCL